MSNDTAIICQSRADNVIVPFDKEKDNFIIKGNNLLALHTLKDMYAGQVNLIYIDMNRVELIHLQTA